MRLSTILSASLLFFLVVSIKPAYSLSANYFDEDGDGLDDYSENEIDSMEMDSLAGPADKRGCIRRGGNCDHRPNDCCVNSACRCNLWGANCRCQRMGIFQKWGK